MYKLLGIIFLLLLPWQYMNAETSNINTSTMRIVGGHPAGQNAWPSIVAIKTTATGEILCGGNLIHPMWVLTASHCITGEAAGLSYEYGTADMVIFAGATGLDSPTGRYMNVQRIIVHPGYNPHTGANDVALLMLAAPLDGATMPIYTNDPPPGTAAVVAGWGAQKAVAPGATPGNFPRELQEATLPIVSNEICNLPASYGGKIQSSMLCAGIPQGGRDACVGDSGGPLMVRLNGVFRQVGIVSQGDGCAMPGKYGIYTRVSAYANWIQQFVPPIVPVSWNTQGSQTNNPRDLYPGGAGSISLPVLAGLLTLLCLNLYRSSKGKRR